MSPKLIDASTYLPFYFFYPFTFLPLLIVSLHIRNLLL